MADVKWTPEQQNAINADSGTILVSAAAGSGKTAVLTERIVRLLTREDNPVRPSELLVVTFTNAAAAEMRSRISSKILKKMKEPGADRKMFAGILSRLDEMNVCTMDSFCIKLVKERFNECGIMPDFTIFDESESAVLKRRIAAEAVDRMFDENPEKANSLSKLFQYGRTDDKLISVIMDLSRFASSAPVPNDWIDGVLRHFTEQSPNESIWGKIICDEIYAGLTLMNDLAALNEKTAAEREELAGKASECCVYMHAITKEACEKFNTLSWDDKIRLIDECNDKISHLPTFSVSKKYTYAPVKLAAAARHSYIKDFFKKNVYDLMCCSESEHADDINRLRPDAELLIETVKKYNDTLLEEKKQINTFDFSDILHFALKLLYDPASPDKKTEAARELSKGFKEILIDEYQDTNKAQDTLFYCLSQNGENMFLVGDVKQSIYRFRMASPELFIEKSENYPYYDGKEKKSKIFLKNNFRSSNGVLNAVNFMFDRLMSKKCGEIDYNEDERLCPAPGKENEPSTADFEMHIVDDNSVEAEAEYIAAFIKQKKEELLVPDGDNMRPARWGDFCILMRSAKTDSVTFSKILRDNGIPVDIDSKTGFFESSEVRLAVSLLHAVNNPTDDVYLLAVMLSPVFGMTPEDAAKIRIETKDTLPDDARLWARVRYLAEAGDEQCMSIKSLLSSLRRVCSLMSAGEAVRFIFDAVGLKTSVKALSDGELRRNAIESLQDMADRYSDDSTKTLGGFVRYIDELKKSGASVKVTGKGETDSVKIMTMHGSKGLEFPFVILARATKKFNDTDTRDILVTDQNLGLGIKVREPEQIKSYKTLSSVAVSLYKKRSQRSEELRVLYVAMTRAKQKLYMISACPSKYGANLSLYNALCPENSAVNPYFVYNASSSYDWFMYSFIHHHDAYSLREECTEYSPDTFPAVFKIDSPAVTENTDEEPVEEAQANPETVERLIDRMSLDYRFLPTSNALAKHTASTLHAERFSPEYFGEAVPEFISGGVSAAEKGTVTHLFMQYCDFANAKISLEDEKQRLVNCARLTPEQAELIDNNAVNAFLNSDLYNSIMSADKVFREKRFTIAESIRDFDSSIPQEFADEKTVIIGKIDLCYVKNGEAVIVDYKTDAVTDDNILSARYREQMLVYIKAVEKTLHYKVKDCVLYSLKGRKTVRIAFN